MDNYLIKFSKGFCLFIRPIYICTSKTADGCLILIRSVRLGVRTPGFHPGSRGSNPRRTASLSLSVISEGLFYCSLVGDSNLFFNDPSCLFAYPSGSPTARKLHWSFPLRCVAPTDCYKLALESIVLQGFFIALL